MSKNTEQIQKNQQENIDYKLARGRELVRGRFIFHQRPGAALRFNVHFDKGDREAPYILQDGEVYEVPRKVAKHLNNSGFLKKYEWYKDASGQDLMRVARRERRYSFENYDFFDLEDIAPKIV